MNKQIKLLLAFAFGLAAFSAHATPCDPCNSATPPAGCPQNPNNPPNGGSMPVGVTFDTMSDTLPEVAPVAPVVPDALPKVVANKTHTRK